MNILDKMPKPLIALMLKEGLTFSIARGADVDGIYLDLNTGMKSHAHLYYENDKYILRMRYGTEGVVETLGDVAYWIHDCMQGRDFMNGAWDSVVANRSFGELDEVEL